MEPGNDTAEDAGTSAPPSLKSLAQSRLLDTLDPSERVQLVTTILGKLSPAELSSIPLAALAAATDAHAAADHTRACLEVLPELRSRLVVSKYSDNTSNFGVNMSYGSNYSLSATYELLRPHTADRRTLKVKVTRGDFSNGDSTSQWATLKITYHTTPSLAASFDFEHESSGRGGSSAIESSSLSKVFHALAKYLQLPFVYSVATESFEEARAVSQAVAREALSRETHDAREAHRRAQSRSGCAYGCRECKSLDQREAALEIELDPFDRKLDYGVADLQTPDALQRDRTFGRLVQIFVPRELRMKEMEDVRDSKYVERTGREEDSVGDLIRGAAVAGVDVSAGEYD